MSHSSQSAKVVCVRLLAVQAACAVCVDRWHTHFFFSSPCFAVPVVLFPVSPFPVHGRGLPCTAVVPPPFVSALLSISLLGDAWQTSSAGNGATGANVLSTEEHGSATHPPTNGPPTIYHIYRTTSSVCCFRPPKAPPSLSLPCSIQLRATQIHAWADLIMISVSLLYCRTYK